MNKKTGAEPPGELKPDTLLAVGGRDPFAHHGYVNTRRSITPPPCSTRPPRIFSPIADATNTAGAAPRPRKRWKPRSGRSIGPACAAVALLPSGLAAISAAMLAVLRAGDHVLVTDSVYLPTRKLCDSVLARYGVTTTPLRSADRRRHRGPDRP